MSEATWAMLRQVLSERYDEFRTRLTRRLGSSELASETLHETWLHLNRTGEIGLVRSAHAYLFRMAINIAVDRRRAEGRLAKVSDIKAFLEVADEAASPEQATFARLEIESLDRALEDLSPRRRAVLLASRLHGTPLHEIAARLDISQRLAELELKHALEHCAARVGKKSPRRCVPGRSETSKG